MIRAVRAATRRVILACTMSLRRASPLACAVAMLAGCGGDDPAVADESATVVAPGQGGGGASATGGAGATGAGGATSGSGGGGQGGGPVPCDVGGVPGTCIDVADCTNGFEATPGYCPGPAEIQCCTPIGAKCDPDVVKLPNAGNTDEAPGVGACPDGMVPVSDFCIDRYEASLVYDVDGSSFSPFLNPGVAIVRAVSVIGAIPQGYISGAEASDACALAGKRLCTDAEWLRACQGPAGTTYPYGDVLQVGVCNDHRDVHPAIEYFETTDDWIWSELGNACLDQLPDSLDAAGANAGCVTAEGVFDMMGNLHEWTADPNGTFRGGYFVDTVINGPGCLYVTTAHATSHWDYSTGFRCCY